MSVIRLEDVLNWIALQSKDGAQGKAGTFEIMVKDEGDFYNLHLRHN